MAIREIRKLGDDVLRKICRHVDKIDDRVICLLDDMIETMHKADGVGLAAPQVGVLKRIAVIELDGVLYELINPEIVESTGTRRDVEGCLSFPGKYGMVTRPQKVTVVATNRNGEQYTIKGEGMLAKALCHEIDHLDGIMYVDKVEEFVELK